MNKPLFVLDSNAAINHLNHKFDVDNFLKNISPDAVKIVSIVTYIVSVYKVQELGKVPVLF